MRVTPACRVCYLQALHPELERVDLEDHPDITKLLASCDAWFLLAHEQRTGSQCHRREAVAWGHRAALPSGEQTVEQVYTRPRSQTLSAAMSAVRCTGGTSRGDGRRAPPSMGRAGLPGAG